MSIYRATPKEVLTTVSSDLKSRHLTQSQIARIIGYKSRQAISLILNSDRYMTEAQANAFSSQFGYYEGFLTNGEGSLFSEHPDLTISSDSCQAVYPKMVLSLRPFADKESFRSALERLLSSTFLLYGQYDTRRLLYLALQCCDALTDIETDNPSKRVLRRRDLQLSGNTEINDDTSYLEYIRERYEHLVDALYDLYNEMSNKCI